MYIKRVRGSITLGNTIEAVKELTGYNYDTDEDKSWLKKSVKFAYNLLVSDWGDDDMKYPQENKDILYIIPEAIENILIYKSAFELAKHYKNFNKAEEYNKIYLENLEKYKYLKR